MQKRTESKKIGQIFENWMPVGRESMRVGGLHWMKGAFAADLHSPGQRLEVVGGHDSSTVDCCATIVHLPLAIAHCSALGDAIHR